MGRGRLRESGSVAAVAVAVAVPVAVAEELAGAASEADVPRMDVVVADLAFEVGDPEVAATRAPAVIASGAGDADVLTAAAELSRGVGDPMTPSSGPDHEDTLSSLCNLAAALWELGDLEGARVLAERVAESHHPRQPPNPAPRSARHDTPIKSITAVAAVATAASGTKAPFDAAGVKAIRKGKVIPKGYRLEPSRSRTPGAAPVPGGAVLQVRPAPQYVG